MQKTFALLVGINDYPPPISSLGGCLKDLDQIENYLTTNIANSTIITTSFAGLPIKQYGDLQICRIENEQATYQNINKGFTQFLQQAREKDVVWFHFSGHGAEQPTAPEFITLEPNGKDQTLVCYQKKPEDYLHLADKELAVLLHQIAANPLKSPHILVTLDCCHSGSGTRDLPIEMQIKSRNLFANGTSRLSLHHQSARSLKTYADEYYSKQLEQNGKLAVPLAKHILFSACESVQVAGDLSTGGVFTNSLVQALTSIKAPFNYTDVFIKTRAIVQKTNHNQSPQCEPLGNFNPYTRFLDGASLGTPNRFEIEKKGEKWWVKCGTIHGLSQKAQQIDLYERAPNSPKIGMGILLNVGGLKSEFQWTTEAPTMEIANYRAVIPTLITTPFLVGLAGKSIALEQLKAIWTDTTSIRWAEDSNHQTDWTFQVTADETHFIINNCRGNKEAIKWPQSKDGAAKFILDSLQKMAKWERFLTLPKPKPKPQIADWVQFELGVMDKNRKVTYHHASKIVLEASMQNCFAKNGALVFGYLPQVKIKPLRRNLYCYLFQIRTNYSIQSDEGAVIYRPEEHTGETTMPLFKKTKAWGLAPEDSQVTCWFKLIVTTEPFDHYQFIQSDLLGDKGGRSKKKIANAMNEWFSWDIEVMMNRVV